MKAAVLIESRKIIVEDTKTPKAGPGEALIRVSLAGICGSDHTLYHGRFGVPLPVIPGHEAIGRIEETGDGVSGLAAGQRVTIQPNFSCGSCELCRAGHKNICPSKVRLGVDTNGVFAEFVKVPANYVWPVPDGLEDDVAVFTEPLAVAVHATKIWAPLKSDRTLIFGAGIMGLLALQLAGFRGAEISACDLVETRLAMAAQLGASSTIGPNDSFESYYNSFDVIYETSGAPAALEQVIRLAAPKGKIIILSLPGKDHPVPTDLIVRKELQIMGSLIYTNEFPESINILKSGKIKTDLLNTGKISLNELDNALREFASPERMKMLVEI
ncbi:MAG: alcohol dehydrogenase catalytic domain-containing protein [Desulfobacterales bacterium]